MAITVTSIAANTVQITNTGTGNTLTQFTDAVAAAITGTTPAATTGWVLHDSTYFSNSGANSQILTQVYKSTNADTSTFKYMIFRWDPIRQEVNTSCCESWNATSHVPTNECFTYYNCAPIGFNLTSCDFIVMPSPRWLVAKSYQNGEPSLWAGVFETMREDPMDTPAANYPCFGWISSNLLLLGATDYASKPLSGYDHTLICMPRTRTGNTGINAAKGWGADYGLTQYPHWLVTGNGAMPYYMGTGSLKFAYTNWDITRREVLPIKPIADYAGVVTNYGQIYGLKMLTPTGSDMNKIKVLVDDDGNANSAGTLKDHWLLNQHYKNTTNNASNSFGNTNLATTNVTVGAGVRVENMVSTGAYYYVSSNTSLYKVNALTNASTQINLTSTPVIYDVKYDGERYIYISTGNGVAQLDTNNDSIVYLAIANGSQTVGITSTAVFSVPAALSATPVVTKILRASFTVETGTVGGFVSGSTTLSTFTETVRLIDTVTDNDGNVYFAPVVGTNTNFKIVKISLGNIITYCTIAAVQNITWQVALTLLDNGNLYVQQLISATQVAYCQIVPSTLSLVASSNNVLTVTTTGVTGVMYYRMTTIKNAGLLITLMRSVSANAASMWSLSMGVGIQPYLTVPVTWSTTMSANGFTPACASNFGMWSDTARVILTWDSGFRIYSKFNGEYHSSGSQLAQMAIVA